MNGGKKRLDWSNHQLSTLSKRFTPRVALQLWGTDVLRVGFFDEIWIASLEYRLRGQDGIVITDCRFPNEIKTIRNLGGKVIRVKKGPEPEWFAFAKQATGNIKSVAEISAALLMDRGIHISEWAWVSSEFDAIIENDGTLEQLEEKTKWTLQNLS